MHYSIHITIKSSGRKPQCSVISSIEIHIYLPFVYENSPESRQHSLPSRWNSKHNFSLFEKVYVRRAPVSSAMRLDEYWNTFYFLIFFVLRHRHYTVQLTIRPSALSLIVGIFFLFLFISTFALADPEWIEVYRENGIPRTCECSCKLVLHTIFLYMCSNVYQHRGCAN